MLNNSLWHLKSDIIEFSHGSSLSGTFPIGLCHCDALVPSFLQCPLFPLEEEEFNLMCRKALLHNYITCQNICNFLKGLSDNWDPKDGVNLLIR